jgi:predicted metal-dependent hydrolase
MKLRVPKFDFRAVPAHWARSAEFAQMVNASSLIPAYVEPYLLKVMNRATPMIDSARADLLHQARIFCQQEMQHMRQHIAFNKRLREQGYDSIKDLEEQFEADLQGFLDKRSLRFNLAYMDGFESMSALACELYFDQYEPLLEGADPELSDLWRWHLAEEYEHRTVAFDVYHALSGLNPISAYFYRLYGYFYAMWHIGRFNARVARRLLAQDRAGMSSRQLTESRARERAVKKVMRAGLLPKMLQILSPRYHPINRPEPKNCGAFLTSLEQRRTAPANSGRT